VAHSRPHRGPSPPTRHSYPRRLAHRPSAARRLRPHRPHHLTRPPPPRHRPEHTGPVQRAPAPRQCPPRDPRPTANTHNIASPSASTNPTHEFRPTRPPPALRRMIGASACLRVAQGPGELGNRAAFKSLSASETLRLATDSAISTWTITASRTVPAKGALLTYPWVVEGPLVAGTPLPA
jgi:hypothetical protein